MNTFKICVGDRVEATEGDLKGVRGVVMKVDYSQGLAIHWQTDDKTNSVWCAESRVKVIQPQQQDAQWAAITIETQKDSIDPQPAALREELTFIVSYLGNQDQDANHAWMVRRIRAVLAGNDPSKVEGWRESDGVLREASPNAPPARCRLHPNENPSPFCSTCQRAGPSSSLAHRVAEVADRFRSLGFPSDVRLDEWNALVDDLDLVAGDGVAMIGR